MIYYDLRTVYVLLLHHAGGPFLIQTEIGCISPIDYFHHYLPPPPLDDHALHYFAGDCSVSFFEDVIQYEYCRAFMVNFCTAVYGRVFVGDI